jgi:hypothetical protein
MIRSTYNLRGNLEALYCATHKAADMVDVKTTDKCIHQGCEIRPSFNTALGMKAIYCATHKEINMIDVKTRNVYMKDV